MKSIKSVQCLWFYCVNIVRIGVFFALLVCYSIAEETPEETLENYHKITPNFHMESIYGAMKDAPENSTNNLRRNIGSPFFAKGIPLIIEGHVYDVSGMPIKNVKVIITQTNHYGSYNFIVDKDSAVYDPHFLSTGISVTNNLGEYSFITIMPGFYGKRAPHVHFYVSHPTFKIETEMFFANHPRNEIDLKFRKLSSHQQKAITAQIFYIDRSNFSHGMRAVFNIYVNYSFKEVY